MRILGIYIGLGLVYFGAMVWLTASGASRAPFDVNWYNSIAFGGYQYNGNPSMQQNPAFFPMYPILVRCMAWLVECQPPMVNFFTSILLFAGTLAFYVKILKNLFPVLNPEIVAAVTFSNPFAIYLLNGYSEAAWLFALSGFVLCMIKKRLMLAVLFINIGALSRPYGILLVLVFVGVLLWPSLEKTCRTGKIQLIASDLRPLVLYTPFAFLTLAGFTLYLNGYFNDPLLFSHVMESWGTGDNHPSLLNLTGYGFIKMMFDEWLGIRTNIIGILAPRLWALLYLGFSAVIVASALIKIVGRLMQRQPADFNPLLMTSALFLLFNWNNSYWDVEKSIENMGRHLLPVYLFAVPAAMMWGERFIHRSVSLNHDTDPPPNRGACTWALPVIIVQMGLFVYFTYRFYTGLWVS